MIFKHIAGVDILWENEMEGIACVVLLQPETLQPLFTQHIKIKTTIP
jgi:deoxyinosine 3'endonuclease (endonuclease V)